jgi:hypothetical protein
MEYDAVSLCVPNFHLGEDTDENVSKTIEKMAVVVNEKVAEGWQPLGGITPTIYLHHP